MIYHITDSASWQLAKTGDSYKSEGFEHEGFIHCCTDQQFPQVANFYFKGRPSIVVLEINEEKLRSELKWESIGAHKFPHVYGPVHLSAIERDVEIEPNADGLFDFPFKPVLH